MFTAVYDTDTKRAVFLRQIIRYDTGRKRAVYTLYTAVNARFKDIYGSFSDRKRCRFDRPGMVCFKPLYIYYDFRFP